ncbi:MAG: hypothetical protein K2Y18_03210 [Alphaproteobacteria bacterium]|jgi:hypothetical protein|nr:hypothetical protein [Alphaproteobacteria bacterium]
MSDKKYSGIWRESAFQALLNFNEELKKYPDFILLAEYADLREQGLRKQAFNKLNEFIIAASSFEESKKLELVQIICQMKLGSGRNSFLLDPQPLVTQVIVPTLRQWIVEQPKNFEPLKWLGLFFYHYSDDSDDNLYFTYLEQSLALNPKDDVVRKVLIERYIDYLDYAMHHLLDAINFGYIGDPANDLELCRTIEVCINGVQDKKDKAAFTKRLKEYRMMIEDWQEYIRANVKISFDEWRGSKKA